MRLELASFAVFPNSLFEIGSIGEGDLLADDAGHLLDFVFNTNTIIGTRGACMGDLNRN